MEILQQLVNGLVLGSSYALVALGLLLVFGVLDLPNFAHGEMFMVAALTTAGLVSRHDWPYLLAGGVSLVVVAAIGVVLDKGVFLPLRNAPHSAMLIASLAFALLLQEGASRAWGDRPFAMNNPLPGVIDMGGVRVSHIRLAVIVFVFLAVVGIALVVHRTAFGRQMRALAQNRDAAMLVGINVRRIRTLTFVLGSLLAGLSGVLLAGTQVLSTQIGFQPTLIAFFVLIMAGVGSIYGAVIGGFLVGILETFSAAYFGPNFRLTAVFIVLVLFLAIRPEGAVKRGGVL